MFRLPIFLIALLHKPQRSHRYACVCEAALSEKYSAPNIKVFSVDYTSRVDISLTGYASHKNRRAAFPHWALCKTNYSTDVTRTYGFFQFSMVKWKQKKQRGISSMKKGKSLRSGFPHQLCMDIIITERGKFYDENIVCY